MNKTGKTAVISIYPGIGDIVWHLPFFKALAQKAKNKKIYLFTKKTTLAKDILKYQKEIADVYYLNETFAAQTGNADDRWGNDSSVVVPTSTLVSIGSHTASKS